MLERIDRVQLAVPNRSHAIERFGLLLDAEPVREDAVAPLAARRTTLVAGGGEIELLSPDGSGPVADHLARFGAGLFAAGFALDDLEALRARLVARRVSFAEANEQILLAPDATGGHGLRCVLSPLRASAAPTGLVSALYEVTNLVTDYATAVAAYTDLFDLTAKRFCPIESEQYGYHGTLTMFDPAERLDRIECVTPYDLGKTMGRFMAKRGECLYMCFAEAPDLNPIRARLQEHAPHDWTGSTTAPDPDALFLHPKALAGMMMGVSRTTVGWTWSGHPERVVPAR